MAKQTVDAMVSGGKATAAPPLGPALGPLGVPINQIIAKINEKTKEFAGMTVPVKVIVDTDSKEFDVTVGTPPTSELIKKEAGVEKGSGNPLREKVADVKIEQIIKVSKMKQDALLGKDAIAKVKEVIGTCDSMGILVEGKQARLTIADINKGMHVDKILAGKTEITAEERKQLEAEKIKLAEERAKMHEEFVKKANDMKTALVGKENRAIRKAMLEAGIPLDIVNEICPDTGAAPAAGAPGVAPAAGAKK
jgi:large subunit ribosomal protein L11